MDKQPQNITTLQKLPEAVQQCCVELSSLTLAQGERPAWLSLFPKDTDDSLRVALWHTHANTRSLWGDMAWSDMRQVALWLLWAIGEPLPKKYLALFLQGNADGPWLKQDTVHRRLRICLIAAMLEAPQERQASMYRVMLRLLRQDATKRLKYNQPAAMADISQRVDAHFPTQSNRALVALLNEATQAPSLIDLHLLALYAKDYNTWPAAWDCILSLHAETSSPSASQPLATSLLKRLSTKRRSKTLQRAPKLRLKMLHLLNNEAHADILCERLSANPKGVEWTVASVKAPTRTLLKQAVGLTATMRSKLCTHLHNPNHHHRTYARLLRLLADSSCLDVLCLMLASNDTATRWEAIRALGYLGADAAIAAITARFDKPTSTFAKGTSRLRFRESTACVLGIWALHDASQVEHTVAQLLLTRPLKASVIQALNAVHSGHYSSPWFAIEEAYARQEVDALLLHEEPDLKAIEVVRFIASEGHHMSSHTMQHTHASRSDDALISYIAHTLKHGFHPNTSELYGWYCRLRKSDASLHALMLQHRSSILREKAIKKLGNLGESGVEVLLPLLQNSRASVRTAAARSLGLTQKESAQNALRSALHHEKNTKTRDMIRRALETCADHAPKPLSFGAWQPGCDIELNDLLTELREVMHAAPTQHQWARLCDLLQRLTDINNLNIGLDYLEPEQQKPTIQASHCIRPSHWTGALKALGHPTSTAWIPVAAWCDPALREHFLRTTLTSLERTTTHRHLDVEQANQHIQAWLFKGWAWCEKHGLPLHFLRLRIDSGMAEQRAPATRITSVQLMDGFGLSVTRETAFRSTGGSDDTYLVEMKVRIPPNHRLRDHPKLAKEIRRGYVLLADESGLGLLQR